ncbi:hypothetical protein ETB97_005950 [Aspergillus alliaceus]|uniref:Uncharacterized protein n=1 Tax=Petromyces alliaceus TaxID=209559 RepID=A0A8H5ZYE5_PETAA|nr:hypothetical protein ETB97_005950 [Aspergillus burnettii]
MAALNLHLQSLLHEEMSMVEEKTVQILDDFLQRASAVPAQVAAWKMYKLTPECLEEGRSEKLDLETFLWQVWDIFIQVARRIPHNHPFQDHMANLVESLASLPPLTVNIWQTSTRLWTDLPLLGPSMREAWISPTYEGRTPTIEEAQSWINLNSFAARLLKLNMTLWTVFAVWELREALEEPCEGSRLDCNVRVAAQWITHGASSLYRKADKRIQDDRVIANGSLYKGDNTLCFERWKFWKDRFGIIGGSAEGITKQMALEAKAKMESAERASNA